MIEKLKSLFTKGLASPLASPDVYGFFNVAPTSSIPVDAYAVLRCPAAQQGVRLIADAIGHLDVCLYNEGRDGRSEVEVVDHPVARLLERPNGWTGESELKRQVVQDALIWGNGLILVSRVNGVPRELHRIDPRACSITIDLDTSEPVYTVAMQGGGTRVYSYRDIVHLRNLSIDGNRGLGLTTIGGEPIGLATVLEKHAARLFSRGARPAGVLETSRQLTAGVIDRLRTSFDQAHGGVENSSRTLILENDMTFKPLQFSSTDAQFLEMRKFQIAEIARLLNIAPVLLGDLEHATLSNAEHLAQQFLDRTITPILELFEDALERTLLTEEERDAGYEIEFDVSNFVRADIAARFSALKTGIEAGVLTLNEARDREGLPPVDGGDTPMRSVQTLPLNQYSALDQTKTPPEAQA